MSRKASFSVSFFGSVAIFSFVISSDFNTKFLDAIIIDFWRVTEDGRKNLKDKYREEGYFENILVDAANWSGYLGINGMWFVNYALERSDGMEQKARKGKPHRWNFPYPMKKN